MSKQIYIKRNPDYLAHKKSEEREDHKYIKREWKNGKWKYWYKEAANKVKGAVDNVADKLGFDEREAVRSKTKERDAAEQRLVTAKKDLDETAIRLKYDQQNRSLQDRMYKSDKDYSTSQQFAKKANAELEAFTAKYEKTPLGALDKFVSKGSDFVKNILGITESEKNKREMAEYRAEQSEKQRLREIEDEAKMEKINRELAARDEQKKRELEKKNQQRLAQENREKTEILDDFSDLAHKSTILSPGEEQALVNPYYDPTDDKYSANCAYCTAAYDLRLRGYDVEAAMYDKDCDVGEDVVESWYEGAETQHMSDILSRQDPNSEPSFIDKITGSPGIDAATRGAYIQAYAQQIGYDQLAEYVEEDIKQHGEGARGQLMVSWTVGSGHSMAWSIENGEVIIRDCQTNKVRNMVDILQYTENLGYLRTDNLEPTEAILEAVRNRTDKSTGTAKRR